MDRPVQMNPSHGFTLIETLIAITVLSISLLALAQLVLVSLQKASFAEYNTKSVQVAQGQIEALRTLFNRQIQTGALEADLAEGEHGPTTFSLTAPADTAEGLREFVVSWQVTNLGGGQKRVAVTVTPPEGTVTPGKSMTVTTLFAP